MNYEPTKSPIQKAALGTMLGGFMLIILLALINPDLMAPPIGTILLVIAGIALAIHFFGMLINAIQHRRVGWAIGIFIIGPLVSIIYFVAKYDTQNFPEK